MVLKPSILHFYPVGFVQNTMQVAIYSAHSQSHEYSYGPGLLTVHPLFNLYMLVNTAEGLGPSQKKSLINV